MTHPLQCQDILHSIFSWLTAQDLTRADQVCKLWHRVAGIEVLWQSHCQEVHNCELPFQGSWKKRFQICFRWEMGLYKIKSYFNDSAIQSKPLELQTDGFIQIEYEIGSKEKSIFFRHRPSKQIIETLTIDLHLDISNVIYNEHYIAIVCDSKIIHVFNRGAKVSFSTIDLGSLFPNAQKSGHLIVLNDHWIALITAEKELKVWDISSEKIVMQKQSSIHPQHLYFIENNFIIIQDPTNYEVIPFRLDQNSNASLEPFSFNLHNFFLNDSTQATHQLECQFFIKDKLKPIFPYVRTVMIYQSEDWIHASQLMSISHRNYIITSKNYLVEGVASSRIQCWNYVKETLCFTYECPFQVKALFADDDKLIVWSPSQFQILHFSDHIPKRRDSAIDSIRKLSHSISSSFREFRQHQWVILKKNH